MILWWGGSRLVCSVPSASAAIAVEIQLRHRVEEGRQLAPFAAVSPRPMTAPYHRTWLAGKEHRRIAVEEGQRARGRVRASSFSVDPFGVQGRSEVAFVTGALRPLFIPRFLAPVGE